ncbi:LAFE_0D04610g1_1 [Lachancea fermentati]|uniref:LAFE_0D04610g1_1 n=1 Tax=Lachancea fermentati TaxID=4955 RepID=A0A1G4MB46_LACFM|nr:LAFE_0D04610g1_1 [Lachancea fermentati]
MFGGPGSSLSRWYINEKSSLRIVFMLRFIARCLCILLILNLCLLPLRRPIACYIHYILLQCPSGASWCILWWQKSAYLEKVIWKLIDYIESTYDI